MATPASFGLDNCAHDGTTAHSTARLNIEINFFTVTPSIVSGILRPSWAHHTTPAEQIPGFRCWGAGALGARPREKANSALAYCGSLPTRFCGGVPSRAVEKPGKTANGCSRSALPVC